MQHLFQFKLPRVNIFEMDFFKKSDESLTDSDCLRDDDNNLICGQYECEEDILLCDGLIEHSLP